MSGKCINNYLDVIWYEVLWQQKHDMILCKERDHCFKTIRPIPALSIVSRGLLYQERQ